jgi:hypothetical protein
MVGNIIFIRKDKVNTKMDKDKVNTKMDITQSIILKFLFDEFDYCVL